MATVNKNPKNLHTVTPALTVKDAKNAIEFYKNAFAAKEVEVCAQDGKVMHAELKIGDSTIMLNDEFPEMHCVGPMTLGGSPITLNLQVDDVDMWFERAVKAGAKVTMPLADQFWGDRYGQVADPYGHKWSMSMHVKDVTEEEVKKASEEWAQKSKEVASVK